MQIICKWDWELSVDAERDCARAESLLAELNIVLERIEEASGANTTEARAALDEDVKCAIDTARNDIADSQARWLEGRAA